MHLEVVLGYPAAPAEVAALLADRAFVEEVLAAGRPVSSSADVSGGSGGDGGDDGPGAGFTVTTVREVPTDDLPDVAKRFVGSSLRVRQVDRWDRAAPDGTRTGTTELTVDGAPVRATATSRLEAAAGGSRQVVSGELTASVPLVGGRLEKAAAPVLRAALEAQERLAGQRLRA